VKVNDYKETIVEVSKNTPSILDMMQGKIKGKMIVKV